MESLGRVRTNFRVRLTDAFAGLRSYFSGEHVIPAPQFASTLSFVVSSLLNLLQLNTQGNGDPPIFQAHPITISTAACSLLIYGLASDIEQRFSSVHNAQIYTNIARRVMMVFGSLLMASLASIFFPNAIQPLLYVVYIFVYAGHELQNWLHRRIIGEVGETENARRLPV